jgi:hypothetical protein
MKLALLVTLGMFAIPITGHAFTCANGVYRAGCAGPNGAAVVRKPPASTYHGTTYHGSNVTCARGVYRAGCAGPNGAAVVRRPY